MASDYNIVPAVNSEYEFPMEIRQAMVQSPEFQAFVAGYLGLEYAPISIRDVVNSGRLSPAELAATIATVIAQTPTYNDQTPDYARPRNASYNKALSLYRGESKEMVDIRTKFRNAMRNQAKCDVAIIGDSRLRGAGIPSLDGKQWYHNFAYHAQLRDMLGAEEGAIYFDPKDARISNITGFFGENVGLTNQMRTTGEVVSQLNVQLPLGAIGFDLYAFRTGNTQGASIAVDGTAQAVFNPGSGTGWKKYTVSGLSSSVHTFALSIAAFTGGSWTLSRIVPIYAKPSLVIANHARSASDATHWDNTAWNSLLPTVLDAQSLPDVVIMGLGTNWNASTYDNYVSIVNKLRAANIKIILLGFGPRMEDAQDPVFNTRRALMYNLSDQFGLPLFDNYQIIGDYELATARGLMADTVHETLQGLGLEAAQLARGLILS